LIQEAHQGGLTIVMVTHDQRIADRADRSVQLIDGRLQPS
jgi:predicted ABC-type transport system involved in lysophospholipase L1 biosynthesis ATPase subunit